MRLPARPAPRAGLSLLEVLAALSIFLMSFVAIGRLVTVATDHSLEVQMQSQATQMAQSKLNEVVIGSLPLSSQSGTIDEDPDWQWSVDAEQQNSDISSLWTVKVRVWRQVDNHEVEATLAQMILDPASRGSMFDQVTVTGSNDTASSSSTTNPSSSSDPSTPSALPGPSSGAMGAAGKAGASGAMGAAGKGGASGAMGAGGAAGRGGAGGAMGAGGAGGKGGAGGGAAGAGGAGGKGGAGGAAGAGGAGGRGGGGAGGGAAGKGG
jgi:Tfp pilus assembly protein PilV